MWPKCSAILLVSIYKIPILYVQKEKNHTNTSTEYTIKVVELQEYIAYVNSEWLKFVYEDS